MKNKWLAGAAALVLIAVTLVYSNHFDNAFHFDDSHTIVNNIYIRDIKNIPLFFKDATTFSSLPANQSYRPVVTTTLAIDYWLGGGLDNPFWFHMSTFIWFLLQGVLMYFLFLKIMNTARAHPWNPWFALLTVAWYMLHTANAETINYIISRSDSLSTLAIVASLYIYARKGWGSKYFLYLVPLGIGILIKPTSVMFLGILFFYILLFETDILEKGFEWKKVRVGILPLAVTFVFGAAGYLFMDKMTPPTWTGGGVDKINYWITQPNVMLHYFKMFFVPDELSADTDWEALTTIADARFFTGILFLAAMATIVFLTIRKKQLRPIAFGIIWFFLALVPTSVIPLAEVLNDHRMFFPFVGLVLSVGWSLALLALNFEKSLRESAFNRGVVLGICTLVLIGYGYGTWERNKVWDNDISLWYDVSVKSPKNGRGLMNYGLALMAEGRYQETLEVFQRALKLSPNYSYLHINLGVVYSQMGNPQQAEYHFKLALDLPPYAPEAPFYYGNWLAQQKRYADAKFYLKRALQLSPAHQVARYTLMDVLAKNGETKELKDLAEETLKIIPGDKRTLQ
jgi:hypothetical protein